jgi:hypothetical protein
MTYAGLSRSGAEHSIGTYRMAQDRGSSDSMAVRGVSVSGGSCWTLGWTTWHELQLRSGILGIEKRDRRKPYRLRWSVNGRRPPFSRSFLVKELAEAFRDEVLKAAARRGERFDEATGLPESMLRKDLDVTWYRHAHEYVAARWKGSAGNSRRSIVESMTCVTPILVSDLRGAPDMDTLRLALRKDFNKGQTPTFSADEARAVAWVKRASLPVSSLNEDAVVTRVLDALASRMDGGQAAPDYYARRLRVTRTCLTFAVRKKRLPKNPFLSANLPEHWTPPKADDTVDPRSVGSPQLVADMLTVASYIGARQGPRFVAFFGCMFYALMRPAEVARLTKAGCPLPEEGWGSLTFGDSVPAPGKEWTNTGDVHEERGLKGRSRKSVRRVPIPPELVWMLARTSNASGPPSMGVFSAASEGSPFSRLPGGGFIARCEAWHLRRSSLQHP